MRSEKKLHKLAAAGLAAFMALSTPALAAVPGNGSIVFDVLRGGDSPMGSHSLRFEQRGDELHVFIDIELEVKLAFVTVFSYTHRNHEVWKDGRLIAIETETDDDGERYFVRGAATSKGFRVETKEGVETLPADVLPTSYWKRATVERSRLLDTQRGDLVEVSTRQLRQETISIDGTRIDATHYRMSGDLDLDLWYAPNGEWVKIAFEARGTEVVYDREQASPQLAETAAE